MLVARGTSKRRREGSVRRAFTVSQRVDLLGGKDFFEGEAQAPARGSPWALKWRATHTYPYDFCSSRKSRRARPGPALIRFRRRRRSTGRAL